jgi:endoglucanase
MPIKRLRFISSLLIAALVMGLVLGISQVAKAQTGGLLAPQEIPGEAVYVPFPVNIKLDGKLSDWKGVPVQTVVKGPSMSADPAENGSFTFSLAADTENLYIMMSMPDKTIITGKHGNAFWNEDSLEFFLNASNNLSATAYNDKIAQININPGDIGKTDPQELTLTGTNSGKFTVTGYVFKTDNGWGFEAAVPLTELPQPANGVEFGFQAQANGASELDRNVKLIWSNADTADNSFQNPSVFGEAIFFKVGSTDIPTPKPRPATPTPSPTPAPIPKISINQTGYLPSAPKRAVIISDSQTPLNWQLIDSQGSSLLTGETIPFGNDAASGDNVHLIDFSAFTTPGTGYILRVDGVESDPFDISPNIFTDLKKQAMEYFYLSRSGIPIEEKYAPGPQWARPAGHLSDNQVTCYQGTDNSGKKWPGCDYSLDALGGWYDAGDFGKYVVNGGISVWTLMDIYERNPQAFPDGSLSLPENQNGVSDVLDEARWEMNFMLGMQVPVGQPQAGMAHHKLHGKNWDQMPSTPPTTTDPSQFDGGRYLFPPSTAATLNLAAIAAQCARIWKTIDADFSSRCLIAAETAWEAASANPNVPAVAFTAGGGDYPDTDFTDEFYWAAAELYITTGKDVYKNYLLESSRFADTTNLYWGSTAALGTISLAIVPNELPADKIQECRQGVIKSADQFIGIMQGQGYLVPLEADGYEWGSNSGVLNRMMIMGLAYDFTQDQRYLNGMSESMDYLLGRNPLDQSYVSGYGENPPIHLHNRFWADLPDQGYPPAPAGVIAGGPNGKPSDPPALAAGLIDGPPAKSYIDDYGSYSTNEVAVNWNAPLAWVATYLDEVGNLVYTESGTTPLSTPTATPTAAPSAPTTQSSTPWLWIILIILLLAIGGLAIWFRRRSEQR